MEFVRKPPQLSTVPKKGFTPQVWRLSAFGSILPILLHDTCVRIQHWIPQLRRFRFVSKCRFRHWKHCHRHVQQVEVDVCIIYRFNFKKSTFEDILSRLSTILSTYCRGKWEFSLNTRSFSEKRSPPLGIGFTHRIQVMANQDMHESLRKNALVFKAPYYIRSTRAGRELLLSHGSNAESPWPNQQVFTISWKYGRNFNHADSNSSRFRRATKTRTKRVSKEQLQLQLYNCRWPR